MTEVINLTNSECLQSAVFNYCCDDMGTKRINRRYLFNMITPILGTDTKLTTLLTREEYVNSMVRGALEAIGAMHCMDISCFEDDLREEVYLTLWKIQLAPSKTFEQSMNRVLYRIRRCIDMSLNTEIRRIDTKYINGLLYSDYAMSEMD